MSSFNSIKKLIIIGAHLILLATLSLVYVLFPKIEINLNDNKNITLRVGEEYKESGAEAYLIKLFNKEKLDVSIKGQVNTNKIGKYVINYKTQTKWLEKEIIKVVNVIDDIKPEITLTKEVIGCKKNNLIEFEAIAIDNYDGDISDNLDYQINNDEIKLIVSDTSNNIGELTNKIKYIDNETPKITLIGSETIYLAKGDTYEEYGASASDSCDGDLTDRIQIQGDINTLEPNTYKVNYIVADNNGNMSNITRQVVVVEDESEIVKFTRVKNKATIYLTFDDGPCEYTKELLDILDAYDIKATFFVTNQFPEYQYLIKETYEKGHTVGIHTYSHKWSIYKSIESYLEDFNKIEKIVYDQTGEHPKLFRFPGGSSNTVSKNYSVGIMKKLAEYMEEKGYIYFDWTFDSGDTSKTKNSVEDIINSFEINLDGDGEYIVLMHDLKKNSIKALPKIIETAKEAGYTFAKLTETSPTKHFKIVN